MTDSESKYTGIGNRLRYPSTRTPNGRPASNASPNRYGSEFNTPILDILLRVHAEESRAVGVSGLQPCFRHFAGTHLTQSSWSVAVWPCQVTVTPIFGVVNSYLLFVPAEGL
jgi:hypothetical protein